nr:hypothetical protein [Orientia tsutsugamushi]
MCTRNCFIRIRSISRSNR